LQSLPNIQPSRSDEYNNYFVTGEMGMANRFGRVAFVLIASSLLGCGSGGPSGNPSSSASPQGTPSIEVLPTDFNFGTVTTNNEAAPLVVTIRNPGSAALQVQSIGFASPSPAFSLALTDGAGACGSTSPSVAAGGSCTFRVAFKPNGNEVYRSSLQIASNGGSPVAVSISGTSQPLSALAVRISQVDNACSNTDATAYVSVVDQGGFPLLGLSTGNFRLFGGSTQNLLLNATLLDSAYKPTAIVAALDNSGSITAQPVMYADMKNGFANLFNRMRGNDVGQLLNFGTQYEVTVPFPDPSSISNPTNKTALVAGLSVPWTKGSATLLYDSVFKAIDDVSKQTAYRRAVIVATDGYDDLTGTGVPASTRTADQVIAYAVSTGVPVFTIAIGDSANTDVLRQMASATGGVYYNANTSQNLATIYQQLASLLFGSQYVLTFTGSPGIVASGVRVEAVSQTGIQGTSETKTVTTCN
jgi:hypothetical protein